jgi:3-hydroxyisobutyrate dehydrogenase
MRISVIGTGVMGEPMARNLKKSGLTVTVFNRTQRRCEDLRGIGIAVADSAAHAIGASDASILMLPTHKEIDEVLGRTEDGKVTTPVAGKTIVVMATVSPAYSLALSQAVSAAGARYVEAPVSGSKTPAQNGQLVIMAAAADPAYIDAVQPAFDAVGKKTVRCGAVPGAMRMKLANNLLLISYFEALAEAVHFARGIGIDVSQFLEMVLAGPLASDVLRTKAPKLLTDDFDQQAPIRHVFKDISLICEEANERGIWLPIARANRALFAHAIDRGQENDDAIGVVKVLREGQPS